MIIGGSSGIGKALAMQIAGDCSRLTIVSSNVDKLDKLKAVLDNINSDCSYLAINVTSLHAYDSIRSVAENEPIDALVYCAGGTNHYGLFDSYSMDDMKNIINVNLTALLVVLKAVLPTMQHNIATTDKRGHVVAISSRSGERALPNLCPYAAAKGGVERLFDGLQKEYAKYGLAFSLICPGSIYTSFTDKWDDKSAIDKHNIEAMDVDEVAKLLAIVLNCEYVINKLSFESIKQWMSEPGVL